MRAVILKITGGGGSGVRPDIGQKIHINKLHTHAFSECGSTISSFWQTWRMYSPCFSFRYLPGPSGLPTLRSGLLQGFFPLPPSFLFHFRAARRPAQPAQGPAPGFCLLFPILFGMKVRSSIFIYLCLLLEEFHVRLFTLPVRVLRSRLRHRRCCCRPCRRS